MNVGTITSSPGPMPGNERQVQRDRSVANRNRMLCLRLLSVALSNFGMNSPIEEIHVLSMHSSDV